MYYPEDLAAMVIAAALGLVFLLRPTVIYHYVVYLYRGADTGSGGAWGTDPEPSERARLAIRVVGVLFLVAAVAIILSPWYRDAIL